MRTALKLSTREARSKLPVREPPYWYELRRGLSIGYRRGNTGGSWLLREYSGGRYTHRRLAAADDAAPSDGSAVLSWSEAQAAALGGDRPTITVPGKLLVRAAWEDYAKTRATPLDARERVTWTQFIEPALGDKPIAELTTGELERWLAAQVTEHGQRRKNGETDPRERRRQAQYTANRRFNLLRAILNSAYRKDPARVPSADAWRRVRPYQRVDRPRLRVLTAAEALRLLNALPPGMRSLARGALYGGARLGELQALTAADVANDAIRVRHSKNGRERSVPLSKDGAAFFAEATAGKAGDALVFEPVSRVTLSRAMKAACTVAGIAPPARFHDLRRSYGSLLLNSGAPIDSIQRLLGHADPRMTQRTYAHLQQQVLRQHVTEHLPSFGRERTNVTALKPRRVRKAKPWNP